MARPVILHRDFYSRDTPIVARELLGKWLYSEIGGQLTAGVIVETEAYLAEEDPACHAAKGRTPGNAAMFEEPGWAYVYPIHSRCCFNVVTEAAGVGAAVLIRAIEPKLGLSLMRQRRAARRGTETSSRELCSGPAKLCEALGIGRDFNQHDLTKGKTLWLGEPFNGQDPGEHVPLEIRVTSRIGVTSAKDLPLRFVWAGHPSASGPRCLR
jgi:DNA-3-methyladenine glycosylase